MNFFEQDVNLKDGLNLYFKMERGFSCSESCADKGKLNLLLLQSKNCFMLKQKLILFFVLACFTVTVRAQETVFSNYPMHQLFYNPAFAGIDSSHQISITGMQKHYLFSDRTLIRACLSRSRILRLWSSHGA